MESIPTSAMPMPWPGSMWRLRDIVDYHLAAAKSLLLHVSRDPERWVALQRLVLADRLTTDLTIRVPRGRPAIDLAANQRLASILDDVDLFNETVDENTSSTSTATPFGRLAAALLLPAPFPAVHGPTSYDLTTHHLPFMVGAVVTTSDEPSEAVPPFEEGRWLVVDSRSHRAPELAEVATATDDDCVRRLTRRAVIGSTLIEPGAWLIDRHSVPEALHPLAHATIGQPPEIARRVRRRDLVLLSTSDQPTIDHGWTRWWLEARRMPYLEIEPSLLPALEEFAPTITLMVADAPPAAIADALTETISRFLSAGGHIIAFGAAGRSLASALSDDIETESFPAGSPVHAPGALLRLVPARDHAIALGLDRVIPAVLQRDGIFQVAANASSTAILGRFAWRDTVMSGWMSDPDAVRDAPAVVEVTVGRGRLHAFAFRPLFRGQSLVTAPLVHNLMYDLEMPSCPPSVPVKTNARRMNDRMS